MRFSVPAVVGAVWLLAACSPSSPTFNVTGASVDPAYWCPGGASNNAYELHATIQARNDTAQAVEVRSASAELVLTQATGPWLEPVGDHYVAPTVSVSPATVPPRSTAALKLTIPSACTSAQYGTGLSSSGSYEVRLQLVTSAGRFAITSGNKHEILAA